MRKLVGLICFIYSSVFIVAIMIGNLSLFSNLISDLKQNDFFQTISLYADLIWKLLYEPIVIWLLSVIAMGNYSKKKWA